MSKLAASHLPYLVREFEIALREGTITIKDAREFCDITFNAVLEQQVRNSKPQSPREVTDHGKTKQMGNH